jgi:hypothetical protein
MDEVIPIEEMTLDDVHNLRSRSLRAYLRSYGQKKIPQGKALKREHLIRLVQTHVDQERQNDRLAVLASAALDEDAAVDIATTTLHRFADLVIRTQLMAPEAKRVVKDAIGESNVIVENHLKAFSPSFRHLYFDLQGTACFPSELYRLVQRADALVISHIISWQPKGKSFVVHDRTAFEKKILEECCGDGDGTYERFVQNLRGFGFVEIEGGSRKGGFRHEYFRRKRPEDVALISAVDEDSMEDDLQSRSETTSEFGESVCLPLGKQEKLPMPTVKITRQAQKSGLTIYDLSKGDDFPTELYRLLEDAEDQGFDNVIGWTTSGKAFAISNEELFVKNILSRHAEKPLISSFEAILIRFGFRKTRKTGNDRRYNHPNFMRGYPQKVRRMTADTSFTCGSSRKMRHIPAVDQRSKGRNFSKVESKSQRVKKNEDRENKDNSHAPTTASSLEPPLHRKGNIVDTLRLILDSTDSSTPVKWLSDGASFSVTDPREFESRIMPKYVF